LLLCLVSFALVLCVCFVAHMDCMIKGAASFQMLIFSTKQTNQNRTRERGGRGKRVCNSQGKQHNDKPSQKKKSQQKATTTIAAVVEEEATPPTPPTTTTTTTPRRLSQLHHHTAQCHSNVPQRRLSGRGFASCQRQSCSQGQRRWECQCDHPRWQ